jgi:hypothetical protein
MKFASGKILASKKFPTNTPMTLENTILKNARAKIQVAERVAFGNQT